MAFTASSLEVLFAVGTFLGGGRLSLTGGFPWCFLSFPLISALLYALLSAELMVVGTFKSMSLL